MKTILCTTALLIGLVSLGNSQDKLPRQAEFLLEKLEEWKAKEIAEFDKNVQAKRGQVAVALKSHLKKATQAGDLKTANLIQAKIDELSKKASETESTSTEKPTTDKEIKSRFVGVWERVGANGVAKALKFDRRVKELTGVFNDDREFTCPLRIEEGVLQWKQSGKDWAEIKILDDSGELLLHFSDNRTPNRYSKQTQ